MSSGIIGTFRDSFVNYKNTVTIYGKAVAAADVDADGYTASGVNVTSAAKTTEGIMQVKFSNVYPSGSLLYAHAIVDDAAVADTGALASPDVTIGVVDEDAAGGATVNYTFRDAGTLQDPDNHTVWFVAVFASSGR